MISATSNGDNENFPEILCYAIGHNSLDYVDGVCPYCGHELEEGEEELSEIAHEQDDSPS